MCVCVCVCVCVDLRVQFKKKLLMCTDTFCVGDEVRCPGTRPCPYTRQILRRAWNIVDGSNECVNFADDSCSHAVKSQSLHP
jgi:hypothetical protein